MALEDILLSILTWGSPIGLGVFFIGLGYLVKCIAGAAREPKRDLETKT